jgi:hypothetical protein
MPTPCRRCPRAITNRFTFWQREVNMSVVSLLRGQARHSPVLGGKLYQQGLLAVVQLNGALLGRCRRLGRSRGRGGVQEHGARQ